MLLEGLITILLYDKSLIMRFYFKQNKKQEEEQ